MPKKRKFTFQDKHKKTAIEKPVDTWFDDVVDIKSTRIAEEWWNKERELTTELMDEFIHLKKYSNRELILSRKYHELKNSRYTERDRQEVLNSVMNVEDVRQIIEGTDEPNIELLSCYKNPLLIEEWMRLRDFISIFPYSSGIGRNLKYILKINTKTAGIISIASDIINIGSRDKWIGWDKPTRLENLIYIGVGSTIVPTQPLGYLTAGGKLLSLTFFAQQIADDWECIYSRPGDPPCKFVGCTTTSLFGINSQYTGMPKYWKTLGETDGSFELLPLDHTYARIREWNKEISRVSQDLSQDYNKKFTHSTITSPRRLHLNFYYKNSNFLTRWKDEMAMTRKDLSSFHKRGVYFAKMFKNTPEFLRGDIEMEELSARDNLDFDREHLPGILAYWKRKWADKRFHKKVDEAPEPFVLRLPDSRTTERSFVRRYK